MNSVLIGQTIRNLRKKNNMSMQELADKLELSQASISRLESGITDINFVQLSTVCDVFNLSMTAFFSLVENQLDLKIETPMIEKKSMDEALIEVIKQMSEEQKKGLYVLLQPYIK